MMKVIIFYQLEAGEIAKKWLNENGFKYHGLIMANLEEVITMVEITLFSTRFDGKFTNLVGCNYSVFKS